jgi:hypothetical protein
MLELIMRGQPFRSAGPGSCRVLAVQLVFMSLGFDCSRLPVLGLDGRSTKSVDTTKRDTCDEWKNGEPRCRLRITTRTDLLSTHSSTFGLLTHMSVFDVAEYHCSSFQSYTGPWSMRPIPCSNMSRASLDPNTRLGKRVSKQPAWFTSMQWRHSRHPPPPTPSPPFAVAH